MISKIAAGETQRVVMEVSRDELAITIRARAHRPLTLWSPLGDWLDHLVANMLLWEIIDAHGGMMRRIADLLSDSTGIDSARGFPLVTITQFPGVPLDESDAIRILVEVNTPLENT